MRETDRQGRRQRRREGPEKKKETLPFKVTGTTWSKQKQTRYMVLPAQTAERGRWASNEELWWVVKKCKSHTDVNTGQRLLHPSCMHYLSAGSHVSNACTPLEPHGCLVTSALFGLHPAPQKGTADSPSCTTSQYPLRPLIASKSPLNPTLPTHWLSLAFHLSWTPSVWYVAYCSITNNLIVSFVDSAK